MRTRLPQTRAAIVHKFKIEAMDEVIKGYITVGLNEEKQPMELFLKLHGSRFNGWTNTIGILISIALQHGVPLEVIVDKLAYQSFTPSGHTKEPHIKHARSIVDYVARWLGYQFIPNYGQELEQ